LLAGNGIDSKGRFGSTPDFLTLSRRRGLGNIGTVNRLTVSFTVLAAYAATNRKELDFGWVTRAAVGAKNTNRPHRAKCDASRSFRRLLLEARHAARRGGNFDWVRTAQSMERIRLSTD
jgi:hypothetical protein